MNPHQADHDGPMHQHIDAELDILGGCLHAPRHIPAVRAILKGSDFVRPAHELIWDALGHLYDTGAPITPTSLRIELEKRKELTRAGGIAYVLQIGDHVGGGDPEYWAEEVHAAALLREEADLGRRIVQRATAPDAEPGGTVAFMEEYLQRYKARTSTGSHLTSTFLDWDPFFATDFGKVELLPGRLMGPGQQITIVGDGKAGKSLLVQEWLWRMASGQTFLGDRAHDPIPCSTSTRRTATRTFRNASCPTVPAPGAWASCPTPASRRSAPSTPRVVARTSSTWSSSVRPNSSASTPCPGSSPVQRTTPTRGWPCTATPCSP
ncbi:hypothetical protein OG508_28195 [Streptomyces sp. NBC_01108]|nr:hypothetical protein OG508_28195 [Streptomyces sp. NBC_01108]